MQKTMGIDDVLKSIGKKAVGKRDGSRYGKRHIPGQMNKTEEQYASILQLKKLEGKIQEWFFESVSLKYADDARFTADFMVLECDGTVTFIDVKGLGPDDPASLVRAKSSAEKFWMFTFMIAKKRGSKKTCEFDLRYL